MFIFVLCGIVTERIERVSQIIYTCTILPSQDANIVLIN